MAEQITPSASFYSWIRKGLGNQITETDTLANEQESAEISNAVKNRPTIQLTTVIGVEESDTLKKQNAGSKVNAKNDSDNSDNDTSTPKRSASKTIRLAGPGDIASINSNAIIRVFPEPNSKGFPINNYPYIEFWEPDFAWRFTPAKAKSDELLRPWLALVFCKSSECTIEKSSWGTDIVTFRCEGSNEQDDEDYKKIFPSPKEIYQAAHAQGNGESAEFCRILGIRRTNGSTPIFEKETEYKGFLIPVFETGRLRGLRGPDYDENADRSERSLNNIVAQKAAWEETLENQRNTHESPLTFPSYYTWTFTTGDLSFAAKVNELQGNTSGKSGIKVDVTHLGEGLDYAVLGDQKPKRKTITVPAALTLASSTTETETSYPNPENDEKIVYDNLKSLLSKSPVFSENVQTKEKIKEEIQTLTGKEFDDKDDSQRADIEDNDDPWVTPPIYGAKHILASSLDNQNDAPWFQQINLDLHYRAIAGLGKKVVQKNQEEFVNRAWQQIDAIKALNAELNRQMLSVNLQDSTLYRNNQWIAKADNENAANNIAQMMLNLPSMAKTNFGKSSLKDALDEKGIPKAFSTVSFQNTTQKILNSSEVPSVMESIANRQSYKAEELPIVNAVDLRDKETLKGLASYAHEMMRILIKNTIFFDFNLDDEIMLQLDFDDLSYNTLDEILNSPKETFRYCFRHHFKYKEFNKNNSSLLVDKKIWEISTLGCTKNFLNEIEPKFQTNFLINEVYYRPTVIALEHSVFKKNFFITEEDCIFNTIENNSKRKTAIKLTSNKPFPAMYFIDRDFYLTSKKGVSFYNLSSESKKVDQIKLKENEVKDILNLRYSEKPLEQKQKEKIFNDLQNLPDRVIIDENEFTDFIEINIDNTIDFCEKMSQIADGEIGSLFKLCANLKNIINDFENNNDSKTENTKSKPSPQSDATDSQGEHSKNLKIIQNLQAGLKNDSAYEKLKSCAATYYGAFFGTNKLSEEQKKYIGDCLASKYPIKAYPIFPEPTYYYLKDIADEFILPGVEDLPNNTITAFNCNSSFIEAYLCGMNTEMGKELLWREYPTDERGSYFKKFWDSSTSIDDIKKDNFFDIASIHHWKGELGQNCAPPQNCATPKKSDLLYFVIKSDLMSLYPDTKITLKNGNNIRYPDSEAFVSDDVYVVGFKVFSNKDSNYHIVFEQAVENIEFSTTATENIEAGTTNNAAAFATNHLNTTSIVSRELSNLIETK